MNKTQRILFLSLILMSFVILLISVVLFNPNLKYDEDWVIGKTYGEIIDKYGEFDIKPPEKIIDGNCYSGKCGYRTKKGRIQWWGTPPDEFYMIWFNDDGLAFDVEKNYAWPRS